MTNIMLDLETLSTRSNAAILIIAAIRFNDGETWTSRMTENNVKKYDHFYRRITLDSCKDYGFHVDPETEEWWSKQNKDIKYEALENPDRVRIPKALKEFSQWIGDPTKVKIWGNGSSFDCGILGNAYKQCSLDIPWKFWLERDLRTIMDIGGIKAYDLPKDGLHNALYDCYRQIIGLQRAEKNLKLYIQ